MNLSLNPRLIMKEGPLAGQEIEFTQPRQMLGRDPSADVRILDDVVSRKHACISRQGERYFLENLGSSNGTYLNGKSIREATLLSSGDLIGLGHTVVMQFLDPGANVAETHFAQATMLETPQTVVEDMVGKTQHVLVPQIVVTVSGISPSTHPLARDVITIGRAEDNDIVIPSPIISRHHARLERSGAGYQLVTLPEASNRLLLEGRALTGKTRLYDCDEIHVDSSDGQRACALYRSGRWRAVQCARFLPEN